MVVDLVMTSVSTGVITAVTNWQYQQTCKNIPLSVDKSISNYYYCIYISSCLSVRLCDWKYG